MTHDLTLAPRRPESRAAFLGLISDAEAALLGFVRQKVRSRSRAEDIVQQTFLKAWSHAGFDPERGDARACLFTIAGHLVADWLRSHASQLVSLDELSERGSLFPSTVSPHAHDPMARMIARERVEILGDALARLDADHREVLERYYLRPEGTQLQIASAMGLSVAAFNSRLNRARVLLKGQLTALREDGPGTPPS